MAMTATQNAFSQFVSSRSCEGQSITEMEPDFCTRHDEPEIVFDQVKYSETRGIESVAIAYRNSGR